MVSKTGIWFFKALTARRKLLISKSDSCSDYLISAYFGLFRATMKRFLFCNVLSYKRQSQMRCHDSAVGENRGERGSLTLDCCGSVLLAVGGIWAVLAFEVSVQELGFDLR